MDAGDKSLLDDKDNKEKPSVKCDPDRTHFVAFLLGDGVGDGDPEGVPEEDGVGVGVTYTITVGCGVGTIMVRGAVVGAVMAIETTPILPRSL